jgi:hypothetical protein
MFTSTSYQLRLFFIERAQKIVKDISIVFVVLIETVWFELDNVELD